MIVQTLFILALALGSGQTAPRGDVPDPDVLDLAMSGYQMVVRDELVAPESLLTIIDYRQPSTEKRLFIIDPQKGEVLHASLVAHGKNTGQDEARLFSNEPGSLRTSLGFYLTGETYHGRHGYSLRLHGLETGINDNALERNIVIHGAYYVSDDFAARYGRLGRSWGCPALPEETSAEAIDLIKNGTCVFIFGNDSSYLEKSVYTGGSASD